MTTQTGTFQKRILAAARAGNYADLYWFAEITITHSRHAPACYPGAWVPVVPVAPDPDESRHWAHLLCELFRANDPSLSINPALTSVEALQGTGCRWYEYGDVVELDAICYVCCAVGKAAHTAAGEGWMCGVCASEWEGEL